MTDPVHLPLGISFFTFQAISYLVDVYRGDAKVEKNVFNLGLYISMFPQLIAGPIVRFKTVAEQIHTRAVNLNQISIGWRIFIIGLAQKVLIANTVALPADQIFSLTPIELTTALAWLGSLCYSLQIYFDFAGYSNMAIGLGLMMGFTFPENFSHPYIAQSITEFWRRWHKSLSGWFRDYLYIPLGGNRGSSTRTYFNLFTVFFLCGLWHGAAWTFIIWGIYHGVFLVLERLKLSDILSASWRPLRHIYLLLVVLFGWVIFRAESIDHLIYFIQAMFGFSQATISNPYYLDLYIKNSTITAITLGVVFSMPVFAVLKTKIQQFKATGHSYTTVMCSGILELFYAVIFIYALMLVASGSYNPFIYFRF
ncbi:MBOAT family O-acyltransferase [Marinicella rhabdoformis]|uniref:MBOAT family O-acyltransferase n=1 Tax=Marinicella rhabdoformis TaxID=2580566 RepID=UPI001C55168F|nr:MBOAT family O-acyltransferase [Marinicella rhabdoformis]